MSRKRLPSRYGRSLKLSLLAGALILLGAGRAFAQGGSKCSTDSNAVNFVGDVASIFNDSTNAPLRARYGIDTLTSTGPRTIVTDDQVCGKLIDATRAAFKAMYAGHMAMGSKDLCFYQMGKYYAVLALPSAAATAGTIASGPQPIMIFTHTYDYITRVDW